jgi:hypothetical protein
VTAHRCFRAGVEMGCGQSAECLDRTDRKHLSDAKITAAQDSRRNRGYKNILKLMQRFM